MPTFCTVVDLTSVFFFKYCDFNLKMHMLKINVAFSNDWKKVQTPAISLDPGLFAVAMYTTFTTNKIETNIIYF